LVSYIKYRKKSRPAMCAYNRAEAQDRYFRYCGKSLKYLLPHEFRVLRAISVVNKHFFTVRLDEIILHPVKYVKESLLPAMYLGCGNEFPLVRHIKYRLNGKQRAHHGSGIRNTPSTLEEIEVVHCKPVY